VFCVAEGLCGDIAKFVRRWMVIEGKKRI
jgi:hypothetical protein